MSNKVLVTGGAGFIGSHLCEKLAEDLSNEIYSLDNYSTGSETNHIKGVHYIKGHTKNINKLIDFKVDIIFHLGEYSRVEQSFHDLDTVHLSNVIGTFEVIKFCKNNLCRLIYAGSSTKFGDGGAGKNQSPYGWTKASNTELIKNFSDWYSLNYAIVYFYNAYGPREIRDGKYSTLVAKFCKQMAEGKPLTIVSPGNQIRNFTHVYDIVSGLIIVGKNGFGDNYGIGNPQAYSIIQIAKIFGGKIKMLPERQGNRMSARIHTEKTIELGWKPKHQITDYIDQIRRNNWE
jgi:UDP-glucose 4-epimerase